jgi:hypothetical protein
MAISPLQAGGARMAAAILILTVLTVLLTALAIMTAVAPEEAVSRLAKWYELVRPSSDLPNWVTSQNFDGTIQWLFVLAPLVSFLLLTYLRGLSKRRADAAIIPLSDAARIAFEALEGTSFADAAVEPNFAPGGPLRFSANKLLSGGIPIFGKRHPSQVSRPIPDEAFFNHEISKDAATLVDSGTGEVTHTDLVTIRGPVNAVIQKLRLRHKADH